VKTEFDPYAHRYEDAVRDAIRFAGKDVEFFTRAKVRHLLALAEHELGDGAELAALDVGCGVGLTDRWLAPAFGSLHGLDVSEEAVAVAARTNPSVRYATYGGDVFPFPEAAFDLVFAICVLHHVAPAARPRLVAEMARVAKPGGLVVVVEHNPYNPLTRLVVHRCEFDEDVQLLGIGETKRLLVGSGAFVTHERYILMVPFEGAAVRRFEHSFRRLPLGAQYLVAGRRPSLP
jgi:SAM-dependent methyltransferase